jgi:hypothetical protein
VALVRERAIPTLRPPPVGYVSAKFCWRRVSRGQCNGSPQPYFRISWPEPLLFLSNSSSLCSRGWVDPVPDPLLLRKSGSAGSRTRNLWICSQELWPLDHRGRHIYSYIESCAEELCSVTEFMDRTFSPYCLSFHVHQFDVTEHV